MKIQNKLNISSETSKAGGKDDFSESPEETSSI
jgi:hypothetical protein